ncbi:MAG: hypothetical protein IPK74_36525 [Deltaproteobacteria bacterium]|nr:hypothetical protein [Deltaproteobacteria bacterium]
MLCGVAAGVLVVGALGFSLLRPLLMTTVERDLGDEGLHPGATSWVPVEREAVFPEPRGLADPRDPRRPMRLWLPLTEHQALGVPFDAAPCQISIEPEHRPAPRLPSDCVSIDTMARLSSGEVLVIGQRAGTTAAWRLDARGGAWQELPPPPGSARGMLVATSEAGALFGGYGERIARFDGTGWSELPPVPGGRYGFRMRVDDDGTIALVGGQRDEAPARAVLFSLLPLVVIGAVGSVAVVAKRRGAPMVLALVGFMAVVVVSALGFLAMLPSLAWH